MMPILLIVAILAATAPAFAQQPQPLADPAVRQLEVEELRAMLDRRREQLVLNARMVDELDSRLKWVLDNWVPKAAEPKPDKE